MGVNDASVAYSGELRLNLASLLHNTQKKYISCRCIFSLKLNGLIFVKYGYEFLKKAFSFTSCYSVLLSTHLSIREIDKMKIGKTCVSGTLVSYTTEVYIFLIRNSFEQVLENRIDHFIIHNFTLRLVKFSHNKRFV